MRRGGLFFSLCRKIGETYSEKLNIDPDGPKTSLSFGVSIQYYKFPLYEALRRARTLLFDHAKSFSLRAGGAPDKNCMAVQLEKHSGQSLALRVDMTSVDALDKLLTSSPSEVEDELLQSVPYHLEQCGKFFEVMDSLPVPSSERYLTFLRNFLSRDDNDPQDTYLQSIAAYYAEQIVTRRCQSADMSEAALDETRGYEPLNTLISVLRLKKFLTERGNEVDE
ncbi:MAG: hypothetical protein LUH36_00095 [Oscillospiraceae bacterium]|nr:hypothetical protein [Oscillospiraceae bacterium]